MSALSVLLFFVAILMISGYKVDPDCQCGLSETNDNRIVGGREATPHQYPWLVAIFYKNHFYCGGSLINDLYVLTAGHCVRWTQPENMHVVLGMHERIGTEGIKLRIAKVILHNKFYSYKLYDENDIALIKLERPIMFNYAKSPVCLPNPDTVYYRKYGVVTGWGKIGEHDRLANFLKYAFIKILTPEQCANTSMGPYVTNDVFCAYTHNTDACQGDSGGPLLYENHSGKTEIVGIVSWGKGCASRNTPGIYTKVSSYMSWIYENTRDAIYCDDEDPESDDSD